MRKAVRQLVDSLLVPTSTVQPITSKLRPSRSEVEAHEAEPVRGGGAALAALATGETIRARVERALTAEQVDLTTERRPRPRRAS